MSSTLTEPHRTAAGKLLDDMNAATMGSLQTIRTFSDDRNYMEGTFRRNQWHGANELVILDVDDGQSFCGALGCGGGRLAAGATSALFRNAFARVKVPRLLVAGGKEQQAAGDGLATSETHTTSPPTGRRRSDGKGGTG